MITSDVAVAGTEPELTPRAMTAAEHRSLLSHRPGRLRRWLPVLLLLILVVAGYPVVTAASARQNPLPPPPAATDTYPAVLPNLRDGVAAQAGELSTYIISARLDPAASTIAAREQVSFTNRTAATLSDIYFRLFPNASYYQPGHITIDSLDVAGLPVAKPELTVAQTALRIVPPRPLMPDQTVKIDLAFTTTVPTNSVGSFGILNHSPHMGTWVLADWYPILAGYDAAHGWRLDPPTPAGDPTFSDEAIYDVSLTLPANLVPAASGRELTQDRSGNEVTYHYADAPARDFTFVAGENYQPVTADAAGTTVTGYANPDDMAGMRLAVQTAADALRIYSQHLGAYPFRSLNLVDVPLAGASGVSWTGLVFIDGARLRFEPANDAVSAEGLRFTVAHEIGHQWWGMSVGANSNDHPFMVEGLTNYTAVLYTEWTVGRPASTAVLVRFVAGPYLALLPGNDGVADAAVVDGQNASVRAVLIYGKAALGFLAIREEIGDAAFFQGLRDYATIYAFRIATPDDLRLAFEHASGRDLTALWHHWFNAAETTPQDVQTLIASN